MSITVKQPPPRGLEAIRAGLNALMSAAADTRRELSLTTEHPDLDAAAAHPAYYAGLEALLDGKPFEGAALVGWRYILVEGERAVGAAEVVAEGGDEGETQFTAVDHGPFAEGMVRAVGVAESLPEVARSDYELRLFDAPSIYLVALWLHGEQEILIPLDPPPPQLSAYTAYRGDELVRTLQEIAATRNGQFEGVEEKVEGYEEG